MSEPNSAANAALKKRNKWASRMRTHLQFKSTQFEIVAGEDEDTNPQIYGLRLAEFIAEHLNTAGYEVTVYAEDWGRCVELKHPDFLSFVGCSSYDEGEWQIQICPYKPVVRRWFKKFDTVPWVEKLSSTVEQILVSHGGAHDLQWWSDKESGRK
jgi:hypothetical protein